MKTFNYTIKDEVGIHARPTGLLAKKKAKEFESTITIQKGEKISSCNKADDMLMGLGVKCGETVTITVEGALTKKKLLLKWRHFFNENL